MHLGLRNTLGDDVAGTLMEHLPPSGWADARLNAIVTGLWTAGTVFAGAFIGLFTLIVTKL